MTAPISTEQLLELLKKSNLVELPRLEAYLQQRKRPASSAAELAQDLIDEGLITHFQRDQLLQGKWRGYTIGKYKVLERLGAGGMGSVYLCEHQKMKHKVAVKVLPTAKNNDPAALGRFQREARASGVLDHPNIVRAHDIDQDGELHYLVMDYIDGVNLQNLVSRTKSPLSVARACHCIHQAARGLQHAFEQGIIHRDIKPANLLLDRDGNVRVLDMGLARFFEDTQDLLTLKYDDNNVLGTADYVSPEQAIDSHDVDIRTDVYSLGATFYFLLSGRPLFPEGRVAQKLIWHKDREPTPILELRPDVPEELAAIVHKMLAKEREDRYQTPAEVMEALEPFVQSPIEPPSAAELPQLCPAARTSLSEGGSSPRTPAQQSRVQARSSVRTLEHPAALAAATASPSTGRGSRHATPRVLSSEESTARVMAALEATPGPAAATAAQPPKARPFPGRLLFIAFILVLGSAGGYFLRLSLKGTPSDTNDGTRVLVVTRSGKPGTYPTVLDALKAAKSGDVVEVHDDSWQEILRLESGSLGQGVTLSGRRPDRKDVVWQPPSGTKETASLLHLSAARGLTIRNFAFDAGDDVLHAVTISGPCPGLVLESSTFVGFRTNAVRLTGVVGEENSPVVLRELTVAPTHESEAGIAFDSLVDQPSRNVRIESCRFEGSLRCGVSIAGPSSDLDIVQCRFANLTDGVVCRKAASPVPVQVSLVGNDFHNLAGAGLRFESVPPVDGSRIRLTDNRFERVKQLGRIDDFKPEPVKTTAAWIWSPEAAGAKKVFFRKTFKLDQAASRATLSIAADRGYVVWLNGHRIGQGTFDAGSRRVTAFDVANRLQKGDNVLAVEAVPGAERAGLLVDLEENSLGILARTLVSDQAWKSSTQDAANWQSLPFKDDGWKATTVASQPENGEAAWKGLVWDLVLQEHFKYQVVKVFLPPSGNRRDAESNEGFPLFEAVVGK